MCVCVGARLRTCMHVWYCGSFYNCGLKKVILQKVFLVEVGLIFIYV